MKMYCLPKQLHRALLFSMFLLAVPMNLSAQAKFFKKAIENGHKPGEPYRMLYTGSPNRINNWTAAGEHAPKYINYAKEQGYIIVNYKMKYQSHSWGNTRVFDYIDFVRSDELGEFLCNKFSGNPDTYSQLKNSGTALLVNDEECTIYDQVLWSGKVINGYLDGKGIGYKAVSPTCGIYFSGEFSGGMAVNDGVVTKKFCADYGKDPRFSDDRIATKQYYNTSVADLINNKNTTPAVKQVISTYINKTYKSDCEHIQSAYTNAIAAAKSKSGNIIDPNFVNYFIGTYSIKCKYDPEKYVEKANEIADYNIVVDALSKELLQKYWIKTKNIFGLDKFEFFSDIEKWHQNLLNRAVQISNNSNNNNDFSAYYQSVKKSIEKKNDDLAALLKKDKHDFEMAQRAAKQEDYIKYRKEVTSMTSKEDILNKCVISESPWEKESYTDPDSHFKYSRFVQYFGGFFVVISWEYNGNGSYRYGYSSRKENTMKWYKTYNQAKIAAYREFADIPGDDEGRIY